jgi:hypothetical protein
VTEAVIITAIVCGSFVTVIGTITVCVNADELAKAFVRIETWWRKRGGE